MDADRFDALSQSLSETPSRRRALRLLVGSVFSGLLGRPLVRRADARDLSKKCKRKSGKQKKTCFKKAKKHNATHSTPSTGVSCAEGQTVYGGACVVLNNDPRNCGDCGTRCRINEQCIAGQCRCLAFGDGTSSCPAGDTCCPATTSCSCSFEQFVVPSTCSEVSSCPNGSRPCTATSVNCGNVESGPAQVCCPSGTTCTAEGTCLQ